MSQLAGAPVRLQFMRWDEHGWDNYGPAIMADVRAAADATGKIVAYEFTGFGMASIGLDPTTQHTGTAVRYAGQRRARHRQLGPAVQHREPPRDRQVGAAASTTTSRRRRCGRRWLRRPSSPRSS